MIVSNQHKDFNFICLATYILKHLKPAIFASNNDGYSCTAVMHTMYFICKINNAMLFFSSSVYGKELREIYSNK